MLNSWCISGETWASSCASAELHMSHGRTWSGPIIISGDGPSGDLGYPSTVQLGDDSLLSVWYERMSDSPRAVLRQARWSV